MTTNDARAKSDIHQGMLDMLVLKVLAHEPLHGYAVAQRLRLLSQERLQIPQGSLYPALHRLENKGLLLGEWTDTATGREAKVYRLTAKGRRRLEEEMNGWRELSVVISMVLGTTG